jgi:hypothetical protein
VLCMFAPSPLTGWLADRAGSGTVTAIGAVLLAAAGVSGATLDTSAGTAMTAMLALLGLGWNAGVVGGSTMLAGSVPATLRPQTEGIGEVVMGLAAGAGAPERSEECSCSRRSASASRHRSKPRSSRRKTRRSSPEAPSRHDTFVSGTGCRLTAPGGTRMTRLNAARRRPRLEPSRPVGDSWLSRIVRSSRRRSRRVGEVRLQRLLIGRDANRVAVAALEC